MPKESETIFTVKVVTNNDPAYHPYTVSCVVPVGGVLGNVAFVRQPNAEQRKASTNDSGHHNFNEMYPRIRRRRVLFNDNRRIQLYNYRRLGRLLC